MHFTYSENKEEDLIQGDIIQRSPYIDEVLRKYHPHFFENKKNLYFIVLSQSCDLARRNGKPCSSPYISLGAVRSLDYVIEQKVKELSASGLPLDFPLFSTHSNRQYRQFLERLYNNNESDLFYLHREPTIKFHIDCCAILRLSVPIKAEHYQECLNARLLTLNEEFRALLGWKYGYIYSRVGTKDWSENKLDELIENNFNENVIFSLDDKTYEKMKKTIKQWGKDNPAVKMSKEQLAIIIEGLPNKKEEALDRLKEILLENSELKAKIGDEKAFRAFIESLTKKIRVDPKFSAILK